MTLNTNSMSTVKESIPSKELPSAQGHTSKLQLSDGSSIYAKLVVRESFLTCYVISVAVLQVVDDKFIFEFRLATV